LGRPESQLTPFEGFDLMIRFASRFARSIGASVLVAAGVVATPAAAADSPTLLGAFKDWSAYTTGTGASKTCYILSQPKSMDPKKAARDPVFFLISDWPARKAKAEPEVVPGYKYKDGSKVTAQVGSDKFSFFTKNDGDSGNAWVEAKEDESRLVDAMRRGSDMIVTGTSSRGTLTKDTYSLGGISAALDKIHSACGM
jgi:hypothetical protein